MLTLLMFMLAIFNPPQKSRLTDRSINSVSGAGAHQSATTKAYSSCRASKKLIEEKYELAIALWLLLRQESIFD